MSKNEEGIVKNRRARDAVYKIVIIVLLVVIFLCGRQIIGHMVDDKIAEEMNDELINKYVMVDNNPADPAVTIAPITQPDEPTEPVVTVDITEPVTEPNTGEPTSDPHASLFPSLTDILSDIATMTNEPKTDPPDTTTPKTPTTTKEPKTEPQAPKGDGENLKIDFVGLKKVNSDIVGWIYGQDGEINFPVLQGETNDTYLRTLYTGKYNINGSIFFHSGNTLYDDDFMILYGHHMKNGAMFGKLDYYKKYSYYQSHPYLMYYTPDAVYKLEICLYLNTDTSERYSLVCRNEAEFNNLVNDYKSRAIYVTPTEMTYGEKYIILSTCRSSTTKSLRINIFCKMTKIR